MELINEKVGMWDRVRVIYKCLVDEMDVWIASYVKRGVYFPPSLENLKS